MNIDWHTVGGIVLFAAGALLAAMGYLAVARSMDLKETIRGSIDLAWGIGLIWIAGAW